MKETLPSFAPSSLKDAKIGTAVSFLSSKAEISHGQMQNKDKTGNAKISILQLAEHQCYEIKSLSQFYQERMLAKTFYLKNASRLTSCLKYDEDEDDLGDEVDHFKF